MCKHRLAQARFVTLGLVSWRAPLPALSNHSSTHAATPADPPPYCVQSHPTIAPARTYRDHAGRQRIRPRIRPPVTRHHPALPPAQEHAISHVTRGTHLPDHTLRRARSSGAGARRRNDHPHNRRSAAYPVRPGPDLSPHVHTRAHFHMGVAAAIRSPRGPRRGRLHPSSTRRTRRRARRRRVRRPPLAGPGGHPGAAVAAKVTYRHGWVPTIRVLRCQ